MQTIEFMIFFDTNFKFQAESYIADDFRVSWINHQQGYLAFVLGDFTMTSVGHIAPGFQAKWTHDQNLTQQTNPCHSLPKAL